MRYFSKYLGWGVVVCLPVLVLTVDAERRSCGTHWTGWMKGIDESKNPCPNQCERGERLNQKTWGKAPDMQYDVQYQCYFPTPKQSAYQDVESSSSVNPAESPTSVNAHNANPDSNRFPYIRGRVDDISAPDGAWLNWHSKLKPLPENLRGKEAWTPVFEKLSLFLKQSPAFSSMREYYPWISYGVDEGYAPLPRGQISIILWTSNWIEPAPETPDKIKLKSRAWGSAPAGPDLFFNWFPMTTSGASDELTDYDWYKDDMGSFFRLRKPDRLIDGFPVHGGWLFVTPKNKPPLFSPVSQERALKSFMAQAQRAMDAASVGNNDLNEALATFNSAEMKKYRKMAIDEAAAGEKDPKRAAEKRAKAERDDAQQERQLREASMGTASSNPIYMVAKKAFDEWSRRLNKMNQNERKQPTYIKPDPDTFLGEDLVSASKPGAISLMYYNPDYVNKSLGKEVPQLLLMSIGSSTDYNRSAEVLAKMTVWERVTLALAERTKWSEIQDFLR